MNKKILFISILIFQYIFSQSTNQIKSSDQLILFRDFKYIKSEKAPGKYISIAITNSIFSPYNGERLITTIREKNKMITYKTTFSLDSSLAGQQLALLSSPLEYAVKIYINGKEIYSIGNTDFNTSIYETFCIPIPADILHFNNKVNTLTIEAYPSFENSALVNFYITGYKKAAYKAYLRTLFSLNIIQASVILALFIFLYALFSFILIKPRQLKYIYFSLFSFFYMFAYTHFFFNFPGSNDYLILTISRITIFFCSAFMIIFLMEFVQIFNKLAWLKYLILLIAFIPTIPLLTAADKGDTIKIFGTFSSLIISPSLVLNMIIIILALVKYKNKYHIVLLAGIFIIIYAGLHDIHYFNNFIQPYCWFVPYGYSFLLITILFLLSYEQAQIYFSFKQKAVEVSQKNDTLKMAADEIRTSSNNVATNSKNLNTTSLKLLQNADNMFAKSKSMNTHIDNINTSIYNISEIADNSNISIASISTAIEQMTTTIQQITSNTENSKNITGQAVTVIQSSVEKLNNFKQELAKASSITELVSAIAGQTKLLSLNASIEASRAGEAGKGFQVVAAEVKDLARQTNESAVKIQVILENVNSSSQETIEDINKIEDIIAKINNSITDISLAVVEQLKTSKEIARNTAQAVEGSNEVSQNLNSTALSAKNISEESGNVMQQSVDIKEISQKINDNSQSLNDMLVKLNELIVTLSS